MANFTPQELEEILQQFFAVTGRRQYVGARYVPIFGRKGEDTIQWDGGVAPYEPLTIVLYQGDSYTSRTYVPAGIDILNQQYWALTGNYNAQIEAYREEVLGFSDRITTNANDIDALEGVLPKADFDSTNTVKKYVDDAADAISEVIPATDFDSTNTVKKYVDDTVGSIDAVIPATDFDSTNTVKKYVDDAVGSIDAVIPATDFDSTNTVKKYVDDKEYWKQYSDIPYHTVPDVKDKMINVDMGGAIDFRSAGSKTTHNCGFAVRANSNQTPGINVGTARTQASADVVALSTFEGLIPYSYKIPYSDISDVTSTTITFTNAVPNDVIEGMCLLLSKNLNKEQMATPTINQSYVDNFENVTYSALVVSVENNTITVDGWKEMHSASNPTAPDTVITPTLTSEMFCFINPQNNVYGEYSFVIVDQNENTPKGYKFYGKQIHLLNSADDAMYSHGFVVSLDAGSLIDGYNVSNYKDDGEVEMAYHALGNIKHLIGHTNWNSKNILSGMTLAGAPIRYNMNITDNTRKNEFKNYGRQNPFGKTLCRLTESQVLDLNTSELIPNTWYTVICGGANAGVRITNTRLGILPTTISGDNTRHDVSVNGSVSIIKQVTGHNTHEWFKFMYSIPVSEIEDQTSTQVDLLIETTNDITCSFV